MELEFTEIAQVPFFSLYSFRTLNATFWYLIQMHPVDQFRYSVSVFDSGIRFSTHYVRQFRMR